MRKRITVIFLMVILCGFISAEVKIPDEFWSYELYGVNEIIPYLQAAGLNQPVFKKNPTADILYRKMPFQEKKQLDGTSVKTVIDRKYLKGNDVHFLLVTYKGDKTAFSCDVSIYCDMDNKKNYIDTLLLTGSDGKQQTISVSSYNFQDQNAMHDLAALYGVFFQLFPIWYTQDAINTYLNS